MLAGFTICSHAGQGCAITTRLLVPASKHDEAVELTAGILAAVPYGDPADPGMVMGPLISEQQRQRVEAYVQGAVDDGATVVAGGKRPEHLPEGFFYEPTLVTGVGADSALAQENTVRTGSRSDRHSGPIGSQNRWLPTGRPARARPRQPWPATSGRAAPRWSRRVAPVYAARNRSRRCSSGTTRRTTSS